MNKTKILLNSNVVDTNGRNFAREDTSPDETIRRKQIIRLYLTFILLLSMMFTVYLWQSTKMVEVKLRIKSIEKDIENLENGNADLRAEISKLQSLARIEAVAKKDLGMTEPRKLVYIVMPENWNKK